MLVDIDRKRHPTWLSNRSAGLRIEYMPDWAQTIVMNGRR
jgi:hypothetical protein